MSKRIPNYEGLLADHEALITRSNPVVPSANGIYERYEHPVVTAAHVPIHWRYDLNADTNPHGLERIGVNAAFNAGAMKWNGKYVLAVRVEGHDRKSYFGFCESENGVDNFRFWDAPLLVPHLEGSEPDVNAYDMRLVEHEDGYIYGIYCSETKDTSNGPQDTSSALAAAGMVRTKDMVNWERLPNLISPSQQRNVTLHPEFVNGRYAVYTRPQDGFIDIGRGGGIGLGYVDDMLHPEVRDEVILFPKKYHTVYELKNGQGPSPIRTDEGWLHMGHGVRNTAAGLRYVLYLFITALDDIEKVIYSPAGYFMAPNDQEIVGDVGNVLFANGWVADDDGKVFIYYASSDTRTHVATSTIEKLVDYCKNTPADHFYSNGSVTEILNLIERNKEMMR